MKYMVFILLIALIIFTIIYPFKIKIFNKSNYMYVNISNILVFRLNILGIIDKIKVEGIKNKKVGKAVFKNVKVKKVGLRLKGLNFSYQLNAYYYGMLCAFFGFLRNYINYQNVEFEYDLDYLGDESIEFESIIRARAYKVINAINRI